MSIKFEDTLIEEFEELDIRKFRALLDNHHIFVCGGLVDGKAECPPSFRDRFLLFSASKYEHIFDAIVLAENFKDYFKDNAYSDLMVFEDEIANISSLVVIFLESPGSLVEFGMFCTKPNFYKKLVIVTPQDQIQSEDSFIYLGPLENIRKKESTSVVVYPWPSPEVIIYDSDHLVDLCQVVDDKLSLIKHSVKFNEEDSSHKARLIAEIIRVSYPVLLGEIELVLQAVGLDIASSEVTRHLYLLNKLGLVDSVFYSGYRYYHPVSHSNSLINFGKMKTGHGFDERKSRMSINQSFVLDDDDQSRKRKSAMKQIIEKLSGGSK